MVQARLDHVVTLPRSALLSWRRDTAGKERTTCLRVCSELLELFQLGAVGEAVPLREHGRDLLGEAEHARRLLVVVDLRQRLKQAVHTPGGGNGKKARAERKGERCCCLEGPLFGVSWHPEAFLEKKGNSRAARRWLDRAAQRLPRDMKHTSRRSCLCLASVISF